jgi:RNA polymerase sigma factor (sigma-70 family)
VDLFRAHRDAGFPERDDAFWLAVRRAATKHLSGHVPAWELKDAVQDVLEIVCRKRETVKQPEAFAIWLFRVAQRHAIKGLQKSKRDAHQPLPTDPSPETATGLLTRLLRSDQREKLRRRVDELRAIGTELRRTFLLKLDGLTNEEIARLENIDVHTVSTRIARMLAHRSFRRALAELNASA